MNISHKPLKKQSKNNQGCPICPPSTLACSPPAATPTLTTIPSLAYNIITWLSSPSISASISIICFSAKSATLYLIDIWCTYLYDQHTQSCIDLLLLTFSDEGLILFLIDRCFNPFFFNYYSRVWVFVFLLGDFRSGGEILKWLRAFKELKLIIYHFFWSISTMSNHLH